MANKILTHNEIFSSFVFSSMLSDDLQKAQNIKTCHRCINRSKMTFPQLDNWVQLYVSSSLLYYIQDHAWFTDGIWSDFMKRFNLYLIGQQRHVLVISDYFSAHRCRILIFKKAQIKCTTK